MPLVKIDASVPAQLANGSWTNDLRLDRIREVDLRSLAYDVRGVLEAEAYQFRSYTWNIGQTRLNQFREGACVGFGWTHELMARPGVVSGVSNEFARNFYFECQKSDQWAGGAYPGASPYYEGTSVIAGARLAKAMGLIGNYYWALEPETLFASLGYKGPAVIGVDWHEGMFDTDPDGFIWVTGDIGGGHCVCVYGIKIVRNLDGSVDWLRSYVKILNSWGAGWGQDGTCKMYLIEFVKLWPGGDFAIPQLRATATVT